jgi:hypothetical protein
MDGPQIGKGSSPAAALLAKLFFCANFESVSLVVSFAFLDFGFWVSS